MAIGMRNNGPALEIERIRADAEELGRRMEVLPDPETTDPAEYEQQRTEWLHQVITGRANLNGELDKYPGLRDVQQEAAEVAEQKESWLTTVRNTPVIKQACDVAQWGWNQVTEHPVRTGVVVLAAVLAYNYFWNIWGPQLGAALEGEGIGAGAANQDISSHLITSTGGGEMANMPEVVRSFPSSAAPTGSIPDYLPTPPASTPIDPETGMQALENIFGSPPSPQ